MESSSEEEPEGGVFIRGRARRWSLHPRKSQKVESSSEEEPEGGVRVRQDGAEEKLRYLFALNSFLSTTDLVTMAVVELIVLSQL